ncbi:hypothetical protein B0H34DRAFT_818876 [Crassisporium funariophilum]|nr:hypothetical protein B0H34DRAFT_818876 [Crassisporium funariophilum]
MDEDSTLKSTPADNRSRCAQNTSRLDEALAAQHLDKFGNVVVPRTHHPRQAQTKRKRSSANVPAANNNDNEDSKDAAFSASQQSSDDESEPDSDVVEITNDELADMLPSKTVPAAANSKKPTTQKSSKKSNAKPTAPPTKKACTATVEEIKDEDSPCNIAARQPRSGGDGEAPAPQPATSGTRKPAQEKRNPIYLFYEQVTQDGHGKSKPGSKYYKCYHGNRKTLVITKAMKGNLNGLIGHLKHFPSMERLYLVLKSRSEPPTPNEIAITSGKSPLDPKAEAKYLQRLETASENIQQAFEKRKAEAAGPWDQEKFEHLIAE